jgi:2,3-bisphosphoglycerate-independent phosphoglycerate mutase
MHKPLVLLILDGWGHSCDDSHNAIAKANTPQWDSWWQHYPHTLLDASGHCVGLPDKQMGNSEVGHMHIGSGRITCQDYTRINQAIKDNDFFNNDVLIGAIETAKKNNKAIHIMGLLSSGGVHSHENHLLALIDLLAQKKFSNAYIHAFLDGRDTSPKSAKESLDKLENHLLNTPCATIKSITGRYFAMDRDNRWDRIKPVYELLTQGITCQQFDDYQDALDYYYGKNITDEFIPATLIGDKSPIKDGDIVLFFNFRADRARQLSYALTDDEFNHFVRNTHPSLEQFVSMTEYDKTIDASVAFPPLVLKNTLCEVVAKHRLSQLRLAETEKYAHVTFFINGGNEQLFDNEDRILIPSPHVATYDLKPEMSALKVTKSLVEAIINQEYDFIICNYANADMVGHTGNFKATVNAIECLDKCFVMLKQAIDHVDGELVITSDHGNAESMYNVDKKQAHTAHTNYPVPLLYVGHRGKITQNMGSLIDIAPTILTLLDINIPEEMEGSALIEITH